MPRAKGHSRLDLQGNAPCGNAVCIMATINEKAPRLDGGQFAAHMGDPINFGHFGNDKRFGAKGQREHL